MKVESGRARATWHRLISLLAAVLAAHALAACEDVQFEPNFVLTIDIGVTSANVADIASTRYGSIRRVGETVHNGEAVGVAIDAHVMFVDGSGDFDGFVTFTYPDGSMFGATLIGRGSAAGTDTAATFEGVLRVIGGTGRFEGISGAGAYEGSRPSGLGILTSTFNLELYGPEIP